MAELLERSVSGVPLTHTRMKARAFYKLAFMLKLEVLAEDPDPVPA
jgi:hypothetical protein